METHKNLANEQNIVPLGLYNQIISLENLFASWQEFRLEKRKRNDVIHFKRNLEDNLFNLHSVLKNKTYQHSEYSAFYISDPKLRLIHKAKVVDRVVHHAVCRVLSPILDPSFIFDSFSCRIGKGTHKAVDRLDSFIRKSSRNYTGACFVLKCDIKKFFSSVDHHVLIETLKQKIDDPDVLHLHQNIIDSFSSESVKEAQLKLFDFRGENRERERERERDAAFGCSGVGIPIGNLTSQLFANVYMNKFDQFVKHKLRVKHYCRYTDDFVIVSDNREYLENLLPKIESFLDKDLKLKLHPEKVTIRKYRQGADFLGYIILPHHRQVRTKTKKRIFNKLKIRAHEYNKGLISEKTLFQSYHSFLGVLSHANCHDLEKRLEGKFRNWLSE